MPRRWVACPMVASMEGWVRAQRSRFEHHLFAGEKLCRLSAWDWLVAHACYQMHTVSVSGKAVELQRGQMTYSVRFLAKAWGWSKTSVARYLTRLQAETMVEVESGTGRLTITVCNYEKFQTAPLTAGTGDDAAPGTAAGHDRDGLVSA